MAKEYESRFSPSSVGKYQQEYLLCFVLSRVHRGRGYYFRGSGKIINNYYELHTFGMWRGGFQFFASQFQDKNHTLLTEIYICQFLVHMYKQHCKTASAFFLFFALIVRAISTGYFVFSLHLNKSEQYDQLHSPLNHKLMTRQTH